MDDIIFEKLKEEDLEEIALLYDAERTVITNRTRMKEIFNSIKNNKDYKMIVAKKDGIIVAFAYAIIHQDIFENCNPFMTVWSIRVKKEYRRKKIGTQLFKYIENIALLEKCEFISLFAEKDNAAANAFYKKMDYECDNGYIKILNN